VNGSHALTLNLILICTLTSCSGPTEPDTPRAIEQGLCQNDPNDPCCPGSPILLDLEGDGFELTDLAGGVRFDLLPGGGAEQISWTALGSDDAWLALDRNANGIIDDSTELFGNFTPQPHSDSRQGYLALAVLDLDRDLVVGSRDVSFKHLRLWQDRNHDGVSEPEELSTLNAHGIAGLDLRFAGLRKADEHGNLFRYAANVFRAPDSQVGPVSFDVFLITQRLAQQAREQGAVQSHGAVSMADVEPEPFCSGDGGIDPPPPTTANWTCDASCNVQKIDPNASCPDRVTGMGSASTSRAACTAAERDANSKVPRGCYKRHCHCDCRKGSMTTTYDDDFPIPIVTVTRE
jgi:hypothetical protein